MHSDDLSPQARKLLKALIERQGWVSRAELASAIGKPTLITYDFFLIEKMVAKGLIEVRYRPKVKLGRATYEYKAKP